GGRAGAAYPGAAWGESKPGARRGRGKKGRGHASPSSPPKHGRGGLSQRRRCPTQKGPRRRNRTAQNSRETLDARKPMSRREKSKTSCIRRPPKVPEGGASARAAKEPKCQSARR